MDEEEKTWSHMDWVTYGNSLTGQFLCLPSCIISVTWTHMGKWNSSDWQQVTLHFAEPYMFIFPLVVMKSSWRNNWLWVLLIKTATSHTFSAGIAKIDGVRHQHTCKGVQRDNVLFLLWVPACTHHLHTLFLLPPRSSGEPQTLQLRRIGIIRGPVGVFYKWLPVFPVRSWRWGSTMFSCVVL